MVRQETCENAFWELRNRSKLVCSLSVSLWNMKYEIWIWNMRIWTPGHRHQPWLGLLWLLLLEHCGAKNPLWLTWKEQKCIREERLLCGCEATVGLPLIMRYFSFSNYSLFLHIHFFGMWAFFYTCLLKWPFWGKRCWLMLSDIESKSMCVSFILRRSADPASAGADKPCLLIQRP